ncbi:hypothetical protein YC2023_083525 [Brassica napus]
MEIVQARGIKVYVTVKNQRKKIVQNMTIRASTTYLRGLRPSVKVSDHNLTGKTRTITVTKIISPAVLPAGTASVENHVALTSEADGDRAGEENKSTCHSEEPKKANRPKHDN